MYKCLEVLWDLSSFMVFIDFVKNFFIIVGGAIALASYRSQNRQRGIDNSLNSLKMFEKTIQDKDIEIWKTVYSNTYEGMGADLYHFVVFSEEDKTNQIPLSHLFISEGKGLYIPESKFNFNEDISDLELGSIRRIAEQLNLIGYEVLYGNVEVRIIYYELGQIMEIIFKWINEIQDKETKESVQFMFPYFMKMCRKYNRTMNSLPSKSYVNFC
ncbi:hypothetical protein [Nodularia sp. NIES-3585]|uniref:hypothetical protein n=1 Tax=Nodularia sp. NIES-3585 TaxID=1973477 RepID=UPI000B5CDD06|nr:hypothetical protein [Nodularia sp. NIES-3585]GAX35072.1 hypothetical protein NIES3585_10780 [Nodularia sp. NIES-3585]